MAGATEAVVALVPVVPVVIPGLATLVLGEPVEKVLRAVLLGTARVAAG